MFGAGEEKSFDLFLNLGIWKTGNNNRALDVGKWRIRVHFKIKKKK
jgi:hypothetical protein